MSMPAPKSFSEDGASGAGGGTSATQGVGWNTPPSNTSIGSYGGPSSPTALGEAELALGREGSFSGNIQSGGFAFDQGGAVPDDDDSDGSPGQDLMSQALESVDKTLQYSYQKYGLGGGDQEAANMPSRPGTQSEYPGGGTYGPGGSPPAPQQQAGMMPTIPGNQSETPGPYQPGTPSQPPPQQMASNMPAVPGSQSNSGIPPVQPMPGPLPPTSNPFGQRTTPPLPGSAQGAIDTDDEAA